MDPSSPRASHRPRAPPPPIRLPSSPSGSRSSTPLPSGSANFSPQKLLYELPLSSPLRSPPPSSAGNRSFPRSRSPPSSDTRRRSFGAALQSRSLDGQDILSPVPSPKRHAASLGGNEPKQADLDVFTECCRRWYYEQNQVAGKRMTQALANVDPSHRATYTRIQASMRSAFHADQTIRRITEFRALVSSTLPGNSLMPAARANPSGPLARKERNDKLSHLIQTHCLSDMPGTHPFFTGLYGIMRLESLPEKLGGAGDRIIEWEVDDAVFMESAGKDFTLEAIAVLKGVLAFEEVTGDFEGSMPTMDSALDDGSDEETGAGRSGASTRLKQISPSNSYSPPFIGTRNRTTSDPFIDPSRSQASTLVPLGSSPSADQSTLNDGDSSHPPSFARGRPRVRRATVDLQNTLSEPNLRVWTFPNYISNPELQELMALFPAFITKRAIARFPVGGASSSSSSKSKSNSKSSSSSRGRGGEPTPRELEEGAFAAGDSAPGEIRVGTGKMRLSEQRRVEGWRGSFWERVREWFRNMFR